MSESNVRGTAEKEAERLKETAREYAEKAQDKAGELGDKASGQVESGKGQAANGLDRAAGVIKDKTGDITDAAGQAGAKVAGGMESTADYLRDHKTTRIWKDVGKYSKNHPVQAIVVAIFFGLLIGRMLRSA
ncbi:MAG TPA: hypothetical protein VG845_01610 [Dehalococcoidia bacterium]|jgi:ElaB/YqjD/DUF883 family membrane-anchored ribosome-binding protein|nr:hypothetical protein [Dehalococcoidia bacterium]